MIAPNDPPTAKAAGSVNHGEWPSVINRAAMAGAGREAGVDGEIGEVEHPEREIHADGHEGGRQAEGDRAAPDTGAGVAGHRHEDHAEGDGADGVGEEAAGG